MNLVGNVAALVPLGVLAPLVSRKITPRRALALAVAAGLSLEIGQAVLRTGTFDVDDQILNALGVMIGYWACATVGRWARSKKYRRIAIAAALAIVAASVALYILYLRDQPLAELPPTCCAHVLLPLHRDRLIEYDRDTETAVRSPTGAGLPTGSGSPIRVCARPVAVKS